MKQERITSLQHALVKHCVKLREDRHYRNENKTFVMEGSKPIQELSVKAKRLFYSSEAFSMIIPAEESYYVTEQVLKKMSGLISPEPYLVEMNQPLLHPLTLHPTILVLDRIADPGNLGTLLRTALALGWDHVYLLPDCCDLFNPKVVRAARGAHFKLKLGTCQHRELIDFMKNSPIHSWIADVKGLSIDSVSNSMKKAHLLILGNESKGVASEFYDNATAVTIPMSNQMESLNVAIAGGILMERLRCRT